MRLRLQGAGLLLVVWLLHQLPWRLAMVVLLALNLAPHAYYRLPPGTGNYWNALELEARLGDTLGYAVGYVPLPKGLAGITCPAQEMFGPCSRAEGRTIFVSEALPWDARYETLAHEGAHALQPMALTKGQEEQFAETVASLVVGRYVEPAHYLAQYRADLLTLFAWQGDIYRAVALLGGR